MKRFLLAALLSLAAGCATPPRPVGATVRIMTYNIRHGAGMDDKVDLGRIAAVIRAQKPDLVALQEVDSKTRRTGGVDQTVELARLCGMTGYFGKAMDYSGGGYGNAILSRHPLANATTTALPSRPDDPRAFARIDARIPGVAQPVVFVCTHLDHQNAGMRRAQTETLASELAKIGGGRTVVLAGDFNMRPGSEELTPLAKAGWKDVSCADLTFPANAPDKKIDYVFASPNAKCRTVESRVVEESMASDHRPVLTVLELVK